MKNKYNQDTIPHRRRDTSDKPARQPHSTFEANKSIVEGEASKVAMGDRPELGTRQNAESVETEDDY
jgi:hypothetical protein